MGGSSSPGSRVAGWRGGSRIFSLGSRVADWRGGSRIFSLGSRVADRRGWSRIFSLGFTGRGSTRMVADLQSWLTVVDRGSPIFICSGSRIGADGRGSSVLGSRVADRRGWSRIFSPGSRVADRRGWSRIFSPGSRVADQRGWSRISFQSWLTGRGAARMLPIFSLGFPAGDRRWFPDLHYLRSHLTVASYQEIREHLRLYPSQRFATICVNPQLVTPGSDPRPSASIRDSSPKAAIRDHPRQSATRHPRQ